MLGHRNIGLRTFILLMYAFAVSQGSTLELKIHEVGVDVFILYFLLGFFSKADLREGDHGELNLPGMDIPHLSTDTVIEFQRTFRFVCVLYCDDNIQCLHIGFVFRDIIADSLIAAAGGDYMVGGYNQTIEIDESMFGMYIW